MLGINLQLVRCLYVHCDMYKLIITFSVFIISLISYGQNTATPADESLRFSKSKRGVVINKNEMELDSYKFKTINSKDTPLLNNSEIFIKEEEKVEVIQNKNK